MRKLIVLIFLVISFTLSGISTYNTGCNLLSSELNCGLHFWADHLIIRNIQLTSVYSVYPGFRIFGVLRANKEANFIIFEQNEKPIYNSTKFYADELFGEYACYHENQFGKFSGSIRVGLMRYLRFPYYKPLDLFTRVPSLSDMQAPISTGYYGELITLDFTAKYNLGAHISVINWDFLSNGNDGIDIIESYASYLYTWKNFVGETRAGILNQELDPVGQSALGYELYLGYDYKSYKIGIMFENIDGKIHTGFHLGFAPNPVTKALGKVRLDYTRAHEGFVMQLPLFDFDLGNSSEKKCENGKLVGKIYAEQLTTFWRMGLMRNNYEHIIRKVGRTKGDDLIVKKIKRPWYLSNESIVSPFTQFESALDLLEWDRQGYRPGQYSRPIIYEFYQIEEAK